MDESTNIPETPKDDPEPPAGISKESARWWRSVVSEFNLEDSHLELLRLACFALDRCAVARRELRKGMTYKDKAGICRPKPESIIERQSAVLFARLVREMKLLTDDADDDEINRVPRNSLNWKLRNAEWVKNARGGSSK